MVTRLVSEDESKVVVFSATFSLTRFEVGHFGLGSRKTGTGSSAAIEIAHHQQLFRRTCACPSFSTTAHQRRGKWDRHRGQRQHSLQISILHGASPIFRFGCCITAQLQNALARMNRKLSFSQLLPRSRVGLPLNPLRDRAKRYKQIKTELQNHA